MRRFLGSASLGLIATILAGSAMAAEEFRYEGICDASAAIALGDDHFIAATDEAYIPKGKANTLLIYRHGQPKPVNTVDLDGYLDTTEETDIEGAARIGNRIYWITSHGRDKDGDERKERWRFFATDDEKASVPTVKHVAPPPYKTLLQDLIENDKKQPKPLGLEKASGLAPKTEGGLNIEGLAATPDGHLLIAFRNPLPGGEAIVIPLTNPDDVVMSGKKPVFGEAKTLDLGKRGIRSMEWVGDHYLIVAGAGPDADDADSEPAPDFALYRWTGGSATPTQVKVDFRGLRPEALFVRSGESAIEILSDDGEEKVDGKKCKKASAEKKSFRAMTLPLPLEKPSKSSMHDSK